jgi:hypothetical protein
LRSWIIFAGVAEKTVLTKINESNQSENMAKKDRRMIQRFQAKPDDFILYDERSAPVRDVSMEGVFVLDPDPLPVGSEIVFIFRAGHQDISLEGIVRHSVDQQGMGIHFTKIPAVSKRRLIIHIATLAPAPFALDMPS